MDLRNTLSKLVPDKSIQAELCRAWLRGDASEAEWYTGVAIAESSQCQRVTARVYAPMPQAVRNYCLNRTERRMQYDSMIGQSLGNWVYQTQQVLDWNLERLEHYTWAANKTKDVSDEAHKILCEARDRFAKCQPNYDDLRLAIYVKGLDSDARTKGGA